MTPQEKIARALEIIESEDTPGYIYDNAEAECVGCGEKAEKIEEIKHDSAGCFQEAVELLRDAVKELK